MPMELVVSLHAALKAGTVDAHKHLDTLVEIVRVCDGAKSVYKEDDVAERSGEILELLMSLLQEQPDNKTLLHLALNPTAFESAEWAKEKGLYHQVFQDAEAMDDAVQEMAMKLCTYNPQALTALKQSLWRGTEGWEELLAERARISGKLILSDFAKEAIAAFKGK